MTNYSLSIPSGSSKLTPLMAKTIADKITTLMRETLMMYCSNGNYDPNLVTSSNAILVTPRHLDSAIPYDESDIIFKICYGGEVISILNLEDKGTLVTLDFNLNPTYPLRADLQEDFMDSLEAVLFREIFGN